MNPLDKYAQTTNTSVSPLDKYTTQPVSTYTPPKTSLADTLWNSIASFGGAKVGAQTPQGPGTPLQNTAQNTSNAIQNAFPGKVVGQGLRNSVDFLGSLSKGDLKGAQNASNANDVLVPKLTGDAVSAIATPASIALGAGTGTTWWGRILSAGAKYGVSGATLGAANATAKGGGPSDIIKSGIEGGVTGFTAGAAGQGIGEILSSIKPHPDAMKIQDLIAPKLSAKETQAAINEGRVARGGDSFIFGKQPDIVAQSHEVQTAARTIQDTIPNAAKMNDVQLSQALDAKINATAQTLKPVMQQTPIDLTTTGDAFDAWSSVQKEQQLAPEFLDNKEGNSAFQKKFENYLNQLQWDIGGGKAGFKAPTPKSLDDVWEARIGYDNSIPANVKNATEASAPVLQFRKSMWLQNRDIFNALINDSASGLGSQSEEAFANMTDMYMARQNIATKAKIDLEGSHGILPTSKKAIALWGLSVGGGAIGIPYIAHKLGL